MAFKVYLANEKDLVREGLKSILEKSIHLNIVEEYYGSTDLYVVVEKLRPNLLVVDEDAFSEARRKQLIKIRETWPKMSIVTILYNIERNNLKYIDMLNINGIFTADVKKEELKRGLTQVFAQGRYVQNSIQAKMNKKNEDLKLDYHKINSLTKRELEVLIHVANGMFNKEIATIMDISERTVKNHISNIFQKIDVSDRTQAAVFAIKNELVKI